MRSFGNWVIDWISSNHKEINEKPVSTYHSSKIYAVL